MHAKCDQTFAGPLSAFMLFPQKSVMKEISNQKHFITRRIAGYET